VALIGLQMEVISSQAYAVVVFMTGITTIVAPVALRFLFRNQKGPEESVEEQEVTRSTTL